MVPDGVKSARSKKSTRKNPKSVMQSSEKVQGERKMLKKPKKSDVEQKKGARIEKMTQKTQKVWGRRVKKCKEKEKHHKSTQYSSVDCTVKSASK